MVERIGWLTKIFGYDMLLARLADRDMQIVNLKTRIQDLEDRLFNKHGLVASGQPQPNATPFPPYLTGRQRLKKLVAETVVGELSEDEEAQIRETLTQ